MLKIITASLLGFTLFCSTSATLPIFAAESTTDKNTETKITEDNLDTQLIMLVYANRLEALQAKLKKVKNINRTFKLGNKSPDIYLLILASSFSNLDTVKAIVEAGADVNIGDDGMNAAEAAALEGKLDIVQYLVAQKTNWQKRSTKGSLGIFTYAATSNHVHIVKWLVEEKNIDIKRLTSGSCEVVCSVVIKDNVEMLNYFVENGFDVNKTYPEYAHSTLLLEAASKGHIKTLKYLQKKGVSFASQDTKGNTALHIAIAENQLKTIPWLLEHSDINQKNNAGFSPLMYGAHLENLEATKLLVKAGADLNVKTNGRDALSFAKAGLNKAVYTYLKSVYDLQ